MDIVYCDDAVLVCVKPAGVLSTDEPGGLPDLLREALGDKDADLRTVHRLDRAVSGLMVLARSAAAASALSREIREDRFYKEYLAMVHGSTPDRGELRDLLWRDRARKMTFVAQEPGKGVQDRVQFASRGWPLYGERKYCENPDDCPLALWSHALGFTHPATGERMRFEQEPPELYPWSAPGFPSGGA